MKHSSFRQPLPATLLPLVSKGYKLGSDDKPRPYEFINLAPAGSLASTGTDMGRFMIAHLQLGAYGTGRILRAETASRMHTSAQTSIGPLNRMELGFYETNINGHRAISHGGDTQWFHSYLHLFPDDGVGLYVSMNSGGKDGAAHAVRTALFRDFANRYLPGPGPAGEGVDAKTAKLHAQQMLGNYESSRRRETGFMALAYLPGQAKVIINEDGTISRAGPDRPQRSAQEVARNRTVRVAGCRGQRAHRCRSRRRKGDAIQHGSDLAVHGVRASQLEPVGGMDRSGADRQSLGAAADGPGLAGVGDGAASLQGGLCPQGRRRPRPPLGEDRSHGCPAGHGRCLDPDRLDADGPRADGARQRLDGPGPAPARTWWCCRSAPPSRPGTPGK